MVAVINCFLMNYLRDNLKLSGTKFIITENPNPEEKKNMVFKEKFKVWIFGNLIDKKIYEKMFYNYILKIFYLIFCIIFLILPT